ncbi:MAG: hypothetical protein WC279_14775 [Sulfurimonas sp.]|jgi:hypothetical protein|uniref:hypothetical protein n=1 Tax=Sulfurimonas sp. TaxID=2022749 RepID=UPI00356A70D0|nr:hypothetical protein [Dehalococcoidia bacterium]
MAPKDKLILQWERAAQKVLLGRKIVKVQYVEYDYGQHGIAFKLDNGTMVYVMADDEGNGPGALHTNLTETPIIPVT